MNSSPFWHSLPTEETLKRLATTAQGLTEAEAEKRLTQVGRNTVAVDRSYSIVRRFLAQFNNLLIYILMASAVVTALMQHWTDTGVIVMVILINALIGVIQEDKAEKALAAIRHMLSPHAQVVRDKNEKVIDASLLVPGDVVALAAGDKVPADLRLLDAHALRTQEAILTGESFDVEKSTKVVADDTPLGDRSCMAYSGTLV